MPTYLDLLGIVAPVFLLLGTGWLLRRVRWLDPTADASMLRLGVYVHYPERTYPPAAFTISRELRSPYPVVGRR